MMRLHVFSETSETDFFAAFGRGEHIWKIDDIGVLISDIQNDCTDLQSSFYDVNIIVIPRFIEKLKFILEQIASSDKSGQIKPIFLVYLGDNTAENDDILTTSEMQSVLFHPIVADFVVANNFPRHAARNEVMPQYLQNDVDFNLRLSRAILQSDNKIATKSEPKQSISPIRQPKPLRRFIEISDEVLVFDGLRYQESNHKLTIDGLPINLTLMEFKLFTFFIKNPDQTFSREDIIKSVFWTQNSDSDNVRNIDVHIRRIRSKLGEKHAKHLCTKHGSGYYWES